jgi:hypothetical protein
MDDWRCYEPRRKRDSFTALEPAFRLKLQAPTIAHCDPRLVVRQAILVPLHVEREAKVILRGLLARVHSEYVSSRNF